MEDKENKFLLNNAANFITFLNMLFGAVAIFASLNGRYKSAVAAIWLAALADRYDGKVARKLGTASEIGVHMDSMGDVISFGVAPAVLVYLSVFKEAGVYNIIGGLSMGIYICAGALRLARFNTLGMNEDNTFSGMPITLGGSIIAILVMFRKQLPPVFYIGALLVIAGLELSRIRIKKY